MPLVVGIVIAAATAAVAQQTATFEPRVGQPGKDVVWVPTPPELVEKMLDLARVTAADHVVDLGSGDGRTVIAAARRGATAVGVEFNPEMVALSKQKASEAGVAGSATFVEGDMYEADISKATVMALYLLPANLDKLMPRLEALPPGSRIVTNTFGFADWDPDARAQVDGISCSSWCEALLWIVPASVAGTWSLPEGTLVVTQIHQVLYGSLETSGGSFALSYAKVRGNDVTFTAGDRTYAGRLGGNTIEGMATTADAGSRPFRAIRN